MAATKTKLRGLPAELKNLDTAKSVFSAFCAGDLSETPAEGWGSFDLSGAATEARSEVWDDMKSMLDTAEKAGRDFTASEKRTYDRLEQTLDTLSELARSSHVDRTGVVAPSEPSARYEDGMPLLAGQTFRGFASARGYGDNHLDPYAESGLSLAKILRGAMTGDWRGSDHERDVMNAMSGGSGAAGGILIPTTISADIIDRARAKTRVMEAGATVVPMDSRTVDVPRWVSDPNLQWRLENAAIAESDPTLDKVTLAAKTLATVVRVSRELVEDTDIDAALREAFASDFAQKIDAAALYGDGTNGAPAGVKNTAAVSKTALATNGASPSWDALVDAAGRLRDNNETPTAQILSDRTARSLGKLKDTTGQYLAPPTYLGDVPRLPAGNIPNNLTVGTSTDTSDVFTADWRQLYIGVRIGLTITLLKERYMPDAGQYGFVAWFRGDIVVARSKAFDVVTGVRA